MFFEGTLQEGISTALQQSKLVVCFVKDDGAESQKWETEYLVDDSIREPLAAMAVMLKLPAGSTEAGYLAAIFPLPKTPTLVIMNKGELKEYIAAGVSRDDFLSRTGRALGAVAPAQPAATQSTQPAAATPSPAAASPSQSSSAPAPAPSPPAPATDTQVQSLLTERAARLEALRAEQKKAAEQCRKDKGKAPESSSYKPKDPAQEKYSAELKQRQQQAREDRARVLQAIEDDKAARRAKAQEREAERARATNAPVSEMPAEKREGREKQGTSGGDGRCKLQIRLFDGSTVRGEWKGTESLGGEVRAWLGQQGGMKGVGGNYGFKVILTPKPSRTIEVGEEGQSLQELDLAPSATLVLVPVATKGASAYPGAAGGNPLTRVLMMILGLFTGLWTLVAGFSGSLFSTAGAPAQLGNQGREANVSGATTGREQGRKGGLRQLRPEGERRNDQQFYNGNSTNFEPRKDDDDEQR